MRMKLLRNLDEYKILNPYRHNSEPLPEELTKQIRKVDYLSRAAIQMLCLPFANAHSQRTEASLMKMALAHEEQENRFQATFGQSLLDLTEVEH
jgi:hypothetical protein